jgi:type II secretory ATPase GspE/PulE/Tfp pilus assembly ATPase PilB-like protein
MQPLDLISAASPLARGLGTAVDGGPLPMVALPFSPVRLTLLVAWFYVCVYCVQRAEFSPLVPKTYKPYANVVTLFTGPVLLLVLFMADTIRKTRRSRRSFFEVLSQQVRSGWTAMQTSLSRPGQEDGAVQLLDSAGRTLDEIYGHGNPKHTDARTLELTETIIADALDHRASDLLIDPRDGSVCTIRLRVDGMLRTVRELKPETCRAVVNSIKAAAGMDISEHRRPQDGAFMANRGTSTAAFRVNTAGALHGEKLSVRVLNSAAGSIRLANVGFTKKQYDLIRRMIRKPDGMILVCGPTGSGKTTTMYAMLNEIDRFARNVITVEDPIEAVLPEASQIEINPKADITFAGTLRSVLRQDPAVICVGEIRDEETAEIALRAAQTGHLVFATLHGDSNASALIRLLDLGVSPLLLSAGVSLVLSQRLVRRLCERCKAPAHLSDSQMNGISRTGVSDPTVFEAVGCKPCEDTGYCGRTAIGDLMVVDDALKARIAQDLALIADLRAGGSKKGKSALRKEGLKRVVTGTTSLEEIRRVVG